MPDKDKERTQNVDCEAGLAQRKVWVFQGNPQRYEVYNSLLNENVKEAAWLVNRYRDEIHAGDIGLIWKARQRSGIYAVGDIISNPQMMYDLEESRKYWKYESDRNQKLLRVRIRYKLRLSIKNPLLKTELEKIPELRNMEILKRAIGTNFRVTPQEWQIILNLLKKRFDFKEHE
jgi:hypothetical protein